MFTYSLRGNKQTGVSVNRLTSVKVLTPYLLEKQYFSSKDPSWRILVFTYILEANRRYRYSLPEPIVKYDNEMNVPSSRPPVPIVSWL